MAILRIAAGIVSFVLALFLGFPALVCLGQQISDDLRQGGSPQFSFVKVAGFTLEGWKIYAFCIALLLLAIGFGITGYYAFSRKDAA